MSTMSTFLTLSTPSGTVGRWRRDHVKSRLSLMQTWGITARRVLGDLRASQARSPQTLHPVHFAHAITVAQLIITVANRVLCMYTVRDRPIRPSASEGISGNSALMYACLTTLGSPAS